MDERLAARAGVAFVVLAALGAAVYANALSNQFVFDDYDLVVDNEQIRSLEKIPEILGFGDARRRYRPVRFVSYSFDHFLFGLDARGYHLSNLIHHVLCSFLVYLIVRRIVGRSRVALVAAVLFVVHPIQTDAVTYISGRRDLLSTLLYLLGFYSFLRYRARARGRYLALGAVAFVLGLFTKESVVTLPALMLAYDWHHELPSEPARVGWSWLRSTGRALAATVRKHAILYAPIFAIAGIFAIDKVFFNNPSRAEGLYGGTILLHVTHMCRILVTYIGLLLWPQTLNADYSYDAFPVVDSASDPEALAAVFALALIAAGWLVSVQRARTAAFATLWFFVTLLPVSQIVRHHESLAEHYLYLPSIGFCLLVALGVDRLLSSSRTRTASYIVLGCVVVLLSLRTIVRNQDWRDDLTLWTKTVLTAPNSSRAHDNLGIAHVRHGQLDRGIAEFQQALRIQPENPEARLHLANGYYAAGRFDEARLGYEAAIHLTPDVAEIHFALGRLFGKQGRVDEAILAFQRAVGLRPDYAKAHHELGTGYIVQGMVEQAQEQYRRTLEIDPSYVSAHRNLGLIAQTAGELDRAAASYQAVLRLDPRHAEAHALLGRLRLERGADPREALGHLQRAVELEPENPRAPGLRRLIEDLAGRGVDDD